MPLFQKSVVRKYLNNQNQRNLNEKWEDFTNHFQNISIQENIRGLKEEEYQEGFLRDLFVKILGYTLRPQPHYNLYRELKNVNDSKKADGGIVIDDVVTAVIELKGTDTTDLGKVEAQVFGYKVSQRGCIYAITSNFEKLRFYIDDSVEFVEFNLFTLTQEEFYLLYLCLAYENLKNGIPKRLKDESLSEEDTITKKLYKDYSLFKRELFQNLIERNPQFDALELFQKSQKLLDRLLFLYFGEDRGLLPPNYIRRIIEEFDKLAELDAYVPLYERFKQNFGYLNSGEKKGVFAYNGGLFKPDEVLDNITIDDDLLYKHSLKLAEYDFASEVDVNILGHIFENSLNEIDEIKAQLAGKEIDKSKTKRKKDGVFYTPKYITKYIVENTVGKLCEDKKAEIGIVEEDYTTDKKRQQRTRQQLLEKLKSYRAWLLQITICDPACGSGAFLNEALNFLINEHQYLDELETKITGGGFVFPEVENSILENNLFGVDLNEESVEIAKLSLWLRTAQENRKLNDLNNNIKCGNSLIDDEEIAGEKAFDWHKEFPKVFEKGGFDVVIGNPPYGVNIKEGKEYFVRNYQCAEGPFELYKFFIEKSLYLINKGGLLGFITPDTWTSLSYFKKLRNIIFSNYNLLKCSETLHDIFQDAVVDTSIFIIENTNSKNKYFTAISKTLTNEFQAEIIENENDFALNYKPFSTIIEKLSKLEKTISSECEIWRGMSAYGAKNPERPYNSYEKETEFHKKLLNGGDIQKFEINWNGEYIKYGNWLHRPRPEYIYTHPKILIQRIRNPKLKQRIIGVYDDNGFISSDGISNVLIKNESEFSLISILGILNSKLINYWFSYFFFDVNIKPEQLRMIPLPNETKILHAIVHKMQLNKENFNNFSKRFQGNIQREFSIETLSKKLQNWHECTYDEFLKELQKAKVHLTLSQKAEWEDYFNEEAQKANELKAEIEKTDKEIDRMVYELYGLSEEEIEIVENS